MTVRLRLRLLSGARAGEVFLARADASLVVGREPPASVFIADPGISRRHFEVSWDGRACRIADLGSTNGTLVNGEPVSGADLRDGDRIEAAPVPPP